MDAYDFSQQLSSVERKVIKRTIDSNEGRSIILAQVLDADIGTVWDACTSPDRIKKWFSPVSGDLRGGGRYAVQGNASGIIEECDAPRKFRLTWELGSDISWLELRLADDRGDGSEGGEQSPKTRLELEHISAVNDHWRKYGAGAGGVGWEMSLVGLTVHLADREAQTDPSWLSTPEFQQFLKQASEAWGRAAIIGGEEPNAAESAVAETTAFYAPGAK